MNLADFAIRQRVFVSFFVVLCVIAGIISYFKLGKLEDPTFTVKSAVIVVLYPGASAEEVELQVTDTVETKVQEMDSLWKLRSLSRPGMSMIFVDLVEELNSSELPQEWDLLRRKMQDVKLQLPPAAQLSIVQDEFSEVYGMLFSVYGDGISPAKLHDYAEELQRRLKTVAGIKKIELHGVKNQVVNIHIPNERLTQYGVSSAQIINQFLSQNIVLDSGLFEAGEERVRYSHGGYFKSLDDIKNLSLKGGVGEIIDAGLVKLSDVAEITLDYQTPATTEARYNGNPAVVLAVSPRSGVNVVSLGEDLKQVIAQYNSELPFGAEIGVIAFQPDEVEKSISNFVINLLESIAIVVVVLWIFMGLKSASIVGFSLFLTILLTLIYMLFTGIDLQRVSLGSFILALGMLVDNAIVITDLFIAKLKQGIERTEAAISAVKEMAIPLLGATIIAFMGASAVLFSKTDSAEFAISLFQVLSSSLTFSWLVAMTVTPLFCWRFIHVEKTEDTVTEGNHAKRYRNAIDWTLNNSKLALLAIVPFIVITILVSPALKTIFMPSSDRALVFLDYWLPAGSKIEKVAEDMKVIEKWLLEQPEVKDITTIVGASMPRFSVTVEPEPFDNSYGQILVNTKDYEGIADLVKRGDAWLKQTFPNAEPRFRDLKLATKDKFSIEPRFAGPDPVVLKNLAEQAKAILVKHPNIKYLRDNWRQESRVIHPILNQEKARRSGINRADIAASIQRSSTGFPLGQLRQGDRLIPIKVVSEEFGLHNLAEMPVMSLIGIHNVPLGQVVEDFQLEGEPSMIWRRNRVPEITVQAGVTSDVTVAEVRNELAEAVEAIPLPPGYTFSWGGEYYDEHRSVIDTLKQTPISFLIMVIILVALFNGFKQPIIILTPVPLAAIGVILFLIAIGKTFSFMGLVGAIALSGMIIKNGIVLLDQIELERKQGRGFKEAIQEATFNRTLSIAMGALTTALGMIPLLTDRLFDSMAATIIGGLFVATLLSLFVMPALYNLLYRNEDTLVTQDATQAGKEFDDAPI